MRRIYELACVVALIGCGGGTTAQDAGLDGATRLDAGRADAATRDGGGDAAAERDAAIARDASTDGGGARDASADAAAQGDGGGRCAPMDAQEGAPCGPTERPGRRFRWNGASCEPVFWCHCEGADCDRLFATEEECTGAYAACTSHECATDADCARGSEWCEGGRCVACDNGGLVCLIACRDGWSLYERNGCHPCECAPRNDCTSDGECIGIGGPQRCYAGAFCWDWCAPGDPTCCFGNVCAAAGCSDPAPVGCARRGCPPGESCDTTSGCASSACGCDATSGWSCTPDCGGGVCAVP